MLGIDAMNAIRECELQATKIYPSVTQVELVGKIGRDFIVRARVNGKIRTYKVCPSSGGKYVAKKLQQQPA
ncbi:MAG: hypothetical protein KGI54_07320 [Pseudomonadota bacterium]|nr:hypothetical protein [Pseudomonadota bacterium]